MRAFAVLLVLFVFAACQSGPDGEPLQTARAAYAASPDRTTAAALIAALDAYLAGSEDAATNANLLNEKAAVHLDQNQFAEATETLTRALADYPRAEDAPNNALLLADVYEHRLRNATGAASVKQAFVDAFPDHPKTAEWRAQFANNPDLPTKVQVLTRELYADTTGRIDYRMANELVQSAEIYALLLPEADDAPELLYQAGQIAGSVRASNKTIELNRRVYERYPDHPRASRALFLTAFAYDNDLNDHAAARPLYEQFLERYPDDEFAESARFQLRNLGKSADEIIKEFEAQQSVQ